MKNKRLVGILVALVVLVGGAVVYSSFNKGTNASPSTNKKTAKIGVLQFVSHPSLDLIYKGIQEGLAEEGYKGDAVKIDFMNAEGDQSKVATMSKQLVSNGNDVLVGIATPSAQGLAAATKAGYTVEEYSVPSTNEIASTMNVMTGKVDAIWIPIDNTIASAFATVVSSNKDAKKPIYPSATAMVEEGGLASVVVDQHDLGVATGKMAAKILKGAKPAETAVEIFNKGKSVVNKKNAKELGITIPDDVLKEAGQVIE